MLKKIFIAGLLCVPFAVLSHGPRYDFVDVRYISGKPDDSDIESDGFAASFSALLAPHAFLTGSYGQIETDEFLGGTFESQSISLGFGFRNGLSSSTDLVLSASVLKADIEGTGSFSGMEADDTGIALSAGLRGMVSRQVELNGTMHYVDIFEDDDTSFELGAVLDLTKRFSFAASYDIADDVKVLTVGGRLHF